MFSFNSSIGVLLLPFLISLLRLSISFVLPNSHSYDLPTILCLQSAYRCVPQGSHSLRHLAPSFLRSHTFPSRSPMILSISRIVGNWSKEEDIHRRVTVQFYAGIYYGQYFINYRNIGSSLQVYLGIYFSGIETGRLDHKRDKMQHNLALRTIAGHI
jgi:hypothetical protein